MGSYKEVTGNLITLAKQGEFDVIAHGCNCFCTMGAGLAPQMADAFGCDKFNMEGESYRGEFGKLGNIDFEDVYINPTTGQVVPFNETSGDAHVLTVVNCYSQFGFGKNHKNGSVAPLDYAALELCLKKINYEFSGERVGLPQIGCHLAGGDWNIVKKMIQDHVSDCDVVVVIYDGK